MLWTSAEFGFATLDDAYSSGSSIMPQKKNPDAYELMRGKAGRLIGDLNAVLRHAQGLPLGYSKDLQEDKEPLFDAVDAVLPMLAVLPGMLLTARFDGERMLRAAGGFALATELADFLAARGVPFREAHRAVGELVRRCEELGVSLEEIPQQELAAAHPALPDLPRELLTPRGAWPTRGAPARPLRAQSKRSLRPPDDSQTRTARSPRQTSQLKRFEEGLTPYSKQHVSKTACNASGKRTPYPTVETPPGGVSPRGRTVAGSSNDQP